MRHKTITFEERDDGKTGIEVERTFYARMENLEPLKKASHVEHQEQWQVKIPKTETSINGGRLRVRKTTEEGSGETSYVMTMKIKAENGEQETPTPVSKDFFEQFKSLSQEGMIKTRYDFAIPDREEIWEVDVFYLPNGKKANWVKIDFEFKSDNKEIPPLPEGFVDAISGQSTDEEDQKFIRKLYDELFLTNATK